MNINILKSEMLGYLRLQGNRKYNLLLEHPMEDLICLKLKIPPGSVIIEADSVSVTGTPRKNLNVCGEGVDALDKVLEENSFGIVEASYLVLCLENMRGEEELFCWTCGELEDNCYCCVICGERDCWGDCLYDEEEGWNL